MWFLGAAATRGFVHATHTTTRQQGKLSSVGVLGLPCLDLRVLSGLLRCLVQLALLDALELLHLVLPVQRVQVLPTLELSDLQTRAAAGSQRPSSAERERERERERKRGGPAVQSECVAPCELGRTFFLLMHSWESLFVGVTLFPSQSVSRT